MCRPTNRNSRNAKCIATFQLPDLQTITLLDKHKYRSGVSRFTVAGRKRRTVRFERLAHVQPEKGKKLLQEGYKLNKILQRWL